MTAAVRVVMLQILAVTAMAAGDCSGPQCNSESDAQALLQSAVRMDIEQDQTRTRNIQSVDDIDMLEYGLLPEHLDKENTILIEGVPVFNYGQTYEGGMNPSLLELAEAKEWIVEFHETASDADLNQFCLQCKLAGHGECENEGHPSEGGMPFVTFKGNKAQLQQAIKDSNTKPAFVESNQPVSIVPEVDEKEGGSLLEIDGAAGPASWGLDRIDDKEGLDNDYKLPTSSSQGKGAHVYVADTGVRTTHSDFEGRAVPGIEALSSKVKVCAPTDLNCANDKHGHGTHCAGTIGGKRFGVAKKTTMYAVKVLSDSGRGSFAGIIASVDWIATKGNKPAVWSASLGGRGIMRSVETTFARALASGVVISVAAGNNNADSCGYTPAFAPSALTVAASNRPRGTKDPRAWFSNYGKCIDIFAPGVAIVSASAKSDTGTATMSGTSMACPHVSGAAALFLGDAKAQGASDLAAVTGLWSTMKAAASGGTVTDAKTGTPNSMLHVGGPAGPPPTTAPTMPPTDAPTMPPTDAPTMPPTDAPTMPPTGAPKENYSKAAGHFVRWGKCKQHGTGHNCGTGKSEDQCAALAKNACDSRPSCAAFAVRVIPSRQLPMFYITFDDHICVVTHMYADRSWNLYVKKTPTTPTEAPTMAPTDAPTMPPTDAPTMPPTDAPTDAPTTMPPTGAPKKDYIKTAAHFVTWGKCPQGKHTLCGTGKCVTGKCEAQCTVLAKAACDKNARCDAVGVSVKPYSQYTYKTFDNTTCVSQHMYADPHWNLYRKRTPTSPTEAPTMAPTDAPTMPPTDAPTMPPTDAPTDAPTTMPPTGAPKKDYIKTAAHFVTWGKCPQGKHTLCGTGKCVTGKCEAQCTVLAKAACDKNARCDAVGVSIKPYSQYSYKTFDNTTCVSQHMYADTHWNLYRKRTPPTTPTKPPTGCNIDCQIKKLTEDVGKGLAAIGKKVQAADSSMNAKFAKLEVKVEAIKKKLGGAPVKKTTGGR